VKLINLREDDRIASVARVEITEIDEVVADAVGDLQDNDNEEDKVEDNLN
jgi:hypothetical protein